MRWSGVRCPEVAALTLHRTGLIGLLTPLLGVRAQPAGEVPAPKSGESKRAEEYHMPKAEDPAIAPAPRNAACVRTAHDRSNLECGLGEGLVITVGLKMLFRTLDIRQLCTQ